MFCNKCGNPAAEGAVFCEMCGNQMLPQPQQVYTQQPGVQQGYPQQDYQQPYPHQQPYQQQAYPQQPYQAFPPQQYAAVQGRKSKTAIIVVACILSAVLIIGGILLYLFSGNQNDALPGISALPGQSPPGAEPHGEYDGSDTERFDALCQELFCDWVTSDTITMHYFLADPDAMGLERPVSTYGEVMTRELWLREQAETEYIIGVLEEIDYDNLSEDRQIIYDIFSRSLELSLILEEEEDYQYYTGYIRPLTGFQAQLPVLLAEFKFYTASDIDLYLALLMDTPRYFNDIIAFERERAARGYFLSDANLETVIEQLEEFLEDPEENFLITITNDKIDAFTELSEEQREQYKEDNRALVQYCVIAAYEDLLDALKSLKGVGPAPGGLVNLPGGERVAHAMLRLRAGTDMSVPELGALINKWRAATLTRARSILFSDSVLLERYQNGETGQIPGGTPEEYLQILEEAMSVDFSQIGAVEYSVLEVHEVLRGHLSPAFFMVPAIDRFSDNTIYINPAKIGDEPKDYPDLFTVLAHEGYPGHLYEMVRFRQSSPHPLRMVMSNNGYTEGWATYAEYFSYRYLPLGSLEAALMREENLYYLLLQAQIDIGVNLLGWTIDDVADLLYDDLGITESEIIEDIYNAVTGMPFNTSMYALGYIEIMTMREDAEDAWGSDFSYLEFHNRFLDIGPAPFEIIRKRILG